MRPIVLFLVGFIICMTASQAASDPSIGSYFYFAALDVKCEKKDLRRDAALEAFRQNFLEFARKMVAAYPESETKVARSMIKDLEATGPSKEMISEFDEFFSRIPDEGIQQLCSSAASDISQRLDMERLLMKASPKK